MSGVEKEKKNITMIFSLVAVFAFLIFIFSRITVPTLTNLGIIVFEGKANDYATALNYSLVVESGIFSTTYFSDANFMTQIYCDELCSSKLRYLYRKGKAMEDSLNCGNSYCLCMGTLNRSADYYNNGIPTDPNTLNLSNKIFYDVLSGLSEEEVMQYLSLKYHLFFADGNDINIQTFNCAPVPAYLTVNDFKCINTDSCFRNIFSHIYANGTYKFSASLQKLNNYAVEMKPI